MIAKNVSLTSTVSVHKNSSATLVTKQASYIPRHKDNNHPKGGSEYVGAGLAAEEELSAESEVEEEGEGEELAARQGTKVRDVVASVASLHSSLNGLD